MPRSRRTLLKTTGFALSGGTLASIAGCLDNASVGSKSSPGESTTADSSTGTETKDIVQWLPDPTTTALYDGYGFQYFDVEGIRDYQDTIHEAAYSRLETQMLHRIPDGFIDKTAVDATLEFGPTGFVALGSFDPEAVGEKLARDRQSSTSASTRTPETKRSTTATPTTRSGPERYHGFDLYGTEYVYAVSEDAVMAVSSHGAPLGAADNSVKYAKAIIDAPTTETSQYVDGNEYVAAMTDVVDDTHALWCYPEAMAGSTSGGFRKDVTSRGFRKDVITGQLKSWRFGTETTHLTFANTYPDTETAESGELKDYIESESDRFGAYDGLDVEIEGRLAWTNGTVPTTEFDHLSPDGQGDGVTTTHQSYRSPF